MISSKKKLFYTKPSITRLEHKYVLDAIKTGWGDKCYNYINLFEKKFCKYIGSQYAISTSSCTGALNMGLDALGIDRGDEVILADTNWIATVSPIIKLGATPVFVDILKDSWCLNPEEVEKSINKKTKAIIATHLYGNLCEMDKLLAIGKKYSIPIIEDAAEAIGSKYGDIKAGTLGLFGVFSFHGSKTITTGEGGMFVTNNKNLYNKVLTLSNHGRSKIEKKQFWSSKVGYKYRMSNIQAALGCAQIERINSLIKRKRLIFSIYKKHLYKKELTSLNIEKKNTQNGFWMPTIVFSKKSNISKKKVLYSLKKKGIDARVFFWPLSKMPMFKKKIKNKNSYDIYKRAINLPSYHDMSNQDQMAIIRTVKKIIKQKVNLK